MRVKLSNGGGRDQALSALERAVGGRPGVNSVELNHRTGSALISYDPDQLDPKALVELFREAHQAFHAVAPPPLAEAVERPASEAAQVVMTRLGAANRSVLLGTHGSVDLRMILPVALAGLAVRQFISQKPRMSPIPWYVLAYYSFDSFIKLHGDGRDGSRRSRSAHR